MGGNLTKDQLNVPQNVQQKSNSYKERSHITDWPTPALRKNIQQSQQYAAQFNSNTPMGGSTVEHSFGAEEENSRKPTHDLTSIQRAGSFSRRQKNVLPLMTQRVLSSTLVLCKVPIHSEAQTSSLQNSIVPSEEKQNQVVEVQELSPRTSNVNRTSKQSEFSPMQKQQIVQKISFNQGKDSLLNASQKKALFIKLGSNEYERRSVLGTASKMPSRQQVNIHSTASRKSKLQKPASQILDQSVVSQNTVEQISTSRQAIQRLMGKAARHGQYQSPEVKRREGALKQNSAFEILDDNKQISTQRQQRNTGKRQDLLSQSGSNRLNQHSKLYNLRRDSSNARLETRDTFLEYDQKIKQAHLNARQQTASKYSKAPLQTLKSMEIPISAEPTQTVNVDLDELEEPLKIEYKDINFNLKIVMLILQYNIDEFPKMTRISASWHTVINDALDEYSNKIENSFVLMNSKALNFNRSYISSTPITFCNQKGMRLDRIFQCEILDNPALINHTMMIPCDFQYIESKKKTGAVLPMQRYRNEYMFDVVKKGKSRVTWIHLSDELPPYSQNEIQMSPGDIIEFAVCLYNMNGIVDLNTFQWEPIELYKIQKNERDPLIYNRDLKILKHKGDRKTKVHCNTNRICEVEDAVPEWITLGKELRDQPRLPISISQFQNRFEVISVQFNELDQHYNKLVLKTKRRGVVESTLFGDKMTIHVKTQTDPITNEIKKRGVMFDRNKGSDKIQLRVGDILVVYNSIVIPADQQPEIVFPESTYNSQVSSAYRTNQTAKDDKQTMNTNQTN